MGALKTTATDAVLTLANLPPFHLLVIKLWHGAALHLASLPPNHPLHKPVANVAALHLASLPPNHPLHKPVANVASRLVKRHPTPLHDLMHRFVLQPTCMEKIQSV